MTILGNVFRQEDPRDNLGKATRYELCQAAKHHGITEFNYGTDDITLEDMIAILRRHGIRDITIPNRILGDYRPTVINAESVKSEKVVAAEPAKAASDMSMTELRSECKKRGIKMARTDNMTTLREKLEQNAA